MDRDSLKRQLIVDEGLRLHAYQDSLGFWTIGIGRNVDRRGGPGITEEEALFLLEHDIERVEKELNEHLPWWTEMNDARQNVLMNMAFNMGINTLMKFNNTLGAMERGNYEAAADGMADSLWYKQTGARAIRLVEIMRKGI